MSDTPALFSTDLYMPAYQPGTYGDWELQVMPFATGIGYWRSDKGYFIQNAAILSHRGDAPKTWMSTTPLEIESSEWGVRPARGHTVIMGFGMGWTAVAAACREDVDRVTVIEINPQVPALFEQTLPPEHRPAEWEKVRVIMADAREWTPDTPVDFMFADTWPVMGQAENLAETRKMQANVQAEALYYWGQELDLVETAIAQGWNPADGNRLSDEAVHAARAALDLPLFLPAPAGPLAEGAWREWCRRMPQWHEQQQDGTESGS